MARFVQSAERALLDFVLPILDSNLQSPSMWCWHDRLASLFWIKSNCQIVQSHDGLPQATLNEIGTRTLRLLKSISVAE